VIDRGFFYGDDLPKEEISQLEQYCSLRNSEMVKGKEKFRLLARERFVREVFLKVGYRARGVIVGLNLPFQISRIALDWAEARAKFYRGGFSFTLLNYEDQDGCIKPHAFAPRIAIKAIDGRRALIGFTSAWQQDSKPEEEPGDQNYRIFRGNFVDCRTLAFSLAGQYFDLEAACEYFSVDALQEVGFSTSNKTQTQTLGVEQRVKIIYQLYSKLISDYSEHPISLPPNQVFSPASLGKAYLREMGIQPPAIRIAEGVNITPEEVLGASMVTYFGGRTECRVRRVAAPVTYVDFLSMYPTVNTLMGLWEFLIAERVEVKDWTQETNELLESMTPELLFERSTWLSLPVLVKVLPDNDVFPVRTKYSKYFKRAYTIAVNEITSPISIWYTLPDCIASKFLTGKSPKVIEAIRFKPIGTRENLKPVNVLGRQKIDPRKDDFFKALVELRNKLKFDESLESDKRKRLSESLKAMVNASSYGIFIELNRQEGEKAKVEVHGLEQFVCDVEAPEKPGKFFFPIVGTFLTGGARLMLTLLECEIARRGGSFAFMDTDSAAIVSNRDGGLVFCPGGDERLPNGRPAIRALSWDEVDEIRKKFDRLNPYNREYVSTSILKLEEENFINGENGQERIELQCFSVSSKRYALFHEDRNGIHIQKASEHGLGNYLTPINRETGKAESGWIEQAWRMIIQTDTGTKPDSYPIWLDEFVLSRIQLSTPKMMEWMRALNAKIKRKVSGSDNEYQVSIKPFNSIEHALLPQVSSRSKEKEKQICLVSPFDRFLPDRRGWIDIHDLEAGPYRIVSPKRRYLDKFSYPGQTYWELIIRHSQQPESKFLTYDGEPCKGRSRGPLIRRHVQVVDVLHIGKEANEIDRVQAGLVGSEEEVLLTYERDLWELIQPILKEIPVAQVIERTGYSRSMVYRLRRGEKRPSSDRLDILLVLVVERAREVFNELGYQDVPTDDRMAVVMYERLLQREDKD
jgi:hypothetical protein